MFTKEMLLRQLSEMNINPTGTLLVHSSMKAIGEVEGGADTVIDALMEYMQDGLLVLPTHTWAQMNEKYNVFNVRTEPSCVGLLTNVFRMRPGVRRSVHPTHSVAAYGKDADAFVSGEENAHTPCAKGGCWEKLLLRKAQIMFLGCPLTKNTFLHGVEEWNGIPNRIAKNPQDFFSVDENGVTYNTYQYRHHCEPPVTEVSQHYGKMEQAFLKGNAICYGAFGDAKCIVGDAEKMAAITSEYLKRDEHLFDDHTPIEVK
ncbi:MAG: AAC(3) family N-acetyltransferase [Clostridia bacterium]|nr:AAC(3) family N-acetyltransferase [Clostridia bacterium]MBQ5770692.1 AAC(3) family N-acetyltransferase [Clostridia bacterium]